MDMGLCIDSKPAPCPPQTPLSSSSPPSSLRLLSPPSCDAAKRSVPAFLRRGEVMRRGGQPLQGQRSLPFKSHFIFSLAAHSSGSQRSRGGLRTAFSRAGSELAQHNESRITPRGGKTEGHIGGEYINSR